MVEEVLDGLDPQGFEGAGPAGPDALHGLDGIGEIQLITSSGAGNGGGC
jgi:hypothetical protein